MNELNKVFDELNSKEKVFWDILNKAVSLDISKGHLKWNITLLASEANVTRSLVYYYFGKSKIKILLEAINFFNEYILGTSAEQLKLWEDRDILPSLILAREVLSKIPAIIPFYFLNKDLDNVIGNELKEQRQVYLHKLVSFFPLLTPLQIQTVHCLIFGLVFYPNLSSEALSEGWVKVLETIEHYEEISQS